MPIDGKIDERDVKATEILMLKERGKAKGLNN